MLKLLDPNEEVKMVSISDPAIDFEKSDLEAYSEKRDLSLLKFKEGCTPTFFFIKNLLHSDEAEILDEHYKINYPDQKKLHGKALSEAKPEIELVKHSNMVIKYFYFACKKFQHEGKIREMKEGLIPFGVVQELGSAVFTRSQLSQEEKKS